MQGVTSNTVMTRAQPSVFVLSFEIVAYLLIIVLALVLRVAELDRVPLTGEEARQGLAAWRALHPEFPGSQITPESPLLFLLHGIGFSIFGASEFSVRIATALAGVGLVISPLLFRPLLGAARALLFSALLLFSPVLLASSRFDSPVIWSTLLAVLALWSLWRFWDASQPRFALLATALAAAMIFLADPTGWVLALILGAAGMVAVSWARLEPLEDDISPVVRSRTAAWPLRASLYTAVGTVILVSTAMLLYLPGLGNISELVLSGVRGLVTPLAGTPPFFPLLTALFYEPITVVFGLVAILLAVRSGALRMIDRFFISWLAFGLAAGLLYRGAGPDHALWIIVPLTGLASSLTLALLEDERHPFLDVPWWGKWVLALGTAGLLAIFTFNVQILSRSIVQVPNGSLATVLEALPNAISAVIEAWQSGQQARVVGDAGNIIWVLLSILLFVFGYFFTVTLWGNRAALRGAALGVLAFACVTSLGSGWGVSVTDAANPVELWHTEATGRETALLASTLTELTQRESGGFRQMPISAMAADDSILAWLIRDYIDVRFISDVSEARAQEIVLLPALAELPDLGGAYVGQDFIISRGWNTSSLEGFDFIPWWLHRRTRVPALPTQTVVLWLRQDIYDGVPFEAGAS